MLEKYQERLYWAIRRIVSEHNDADDVLQNTMIKVYRNIDRFEEKSSLYTWLYRIATHEALSFIKKKNRVSGMSLDDTAFTVPPDLRADPYFDGDLAQAILAEAVGQLPEKQKCVFELRYYEDMSYREMSETLGTSEGALKASFHHAVKKVEEHLRSRQIDV